MPKLSADETHVWIVEDFLADRPKLKHLRARKRGDTITLESGPKADPIAHARVRRVTAQWWSFELPDHRGRWSEASLDRVPLTEALGTLHQVYPWALKPRA
jgi:hypothetical protein